VSVAGTFAEDIRNAEPRAPGAAAGRRTVMQNIAWLQQTAVVREAAVRAVAALRCCTRQASRERAGRPGPRAVWSYAAD